MPVPEKAGRKTSSPEIDARSIRIGPGMRPFIAMSPRRWESAPLSAMTVSSCRVHFTQWLPSAFSISNSAMIALGASAVGPCRRRLRIPVF